MFFYGSLHLNWFIQRKHENSRQWNSTWNFDGLQRYVVLYVTTDVSKKPGVSLLYKAP